MELFNCEAGLLPLIIAGVLIGKRFERTSGMILLPGQDFDVTKFGGLRLSTCRFCLVIFLNDFLVNKTKPTKWCVPYCLPEMRSVRRAART